MLGKSTRQLSSSSKKLVASLRRLKSNWRPSKKKTRSLKRDSIISPPNKVSSIVIFIDIVITFYVITVLMDGIARAGAYISMSYFFVTIIMEFCTSMKIGCEHYYLSFYQPLPIPTDEGVGWVHQRQVETDKDPWELYSRRSARRTLT